MMTDNNLPFNIIFFFTYGVLIGSISQNILYSILFIIIYEFYLFHITRFFPPKVREIDRIILNIIYIGGWILGHCLMLNETGLEKIFDGYLRFDHYDNRLFIN